MADPHSFKEWYELAKKKAEEVIPSIDKDLKVAVVPDAESREGFALHFSHKSNPKIAWNQAIITTTAYIAEMPAYIKSAYEGKKNA